MWKKWFSISMTVWMSKEDWLHFGFLFQVMSLQLDFSPISPDYYSSKDSSWNKTVSPRTWDSDLQVLLDPSTAFQEIAECINLPHTSPQSYQLVVLAEGNDVCPSGTHFKPLHCWFFIICWAGRGRRRQAHIYLYWLQRQ